MAATNFSSSVFNAADCGDKEHTLKNELKSIRI